MGGKGDHMPFTAGCQEGGKIGSRVEWMMSGRGENLALRRMPSGESAQAFFRVLPAAA